MKLTGKFLLGCALIIMSALPLFAQNASIKIGKNEIGLNQYFTISIEVNNDRLKQHSEFPEIEGFVKRGTSSSTTTNFINGRMSSTQSLTQNYQASAQGTFRLPPFTMLINGEEYRSEGTTITVGEPVQRQARRSRDPFDDFFNRNNEATDFIDVEADAFLALTLSDEEVFVGEGFTATLAFYVAESNRAEMRFYDLANQITEIIKAIKPENCWEENFTIDQIEGEPIVLNNKNYTRYKIYQTAYYPLNIGQIDFPSIGLKMIKYRVAKNPSFFGRNRQEDYETFYSRNKSVKVIDLPAHPLKDKVAVGDYELEEEISTTSLKTGESFNYQFNIVGEGNISGIDAPAPHAGKYFDFYAPNIRQSINRSRGRVSGKKSYDYYAIPNEPGTYDLSDYFSWIFFNPEKEAYDTLNSKITVQVEGESRKNLSIASNDLGDFYDIIPETNNELKELDESIWIKYVINALVVIILGFTVFILYKKPVT